MARRFDIEFTLSYSGRLAEFHEIDLYDVSQALIGFQRSIALTTHLVLNHEIITQSPSLKGASVLALPAEEGSWKVIAGVVITTLGGVYAVGTAPQDTPLGHLVYSAYDYVISETLGVHVDYEKSLGQVYEEVEKNGKKLPKLKEHQLDSLTEKCSSAITEIHRPIYRKETAENAVISAEYGGKQNNVGPNFTIDTYEYARETITEEHPEVIAGRVSSYNRNTYKGRIFVAEEGRPVSFEISKTARTNRAVQLIANSLSVNAVKTQEAKWSTVYCRVFRNRSKSGHLKSYMIVEVLSSPEGS